MGAGESRDGDVFNCAGFDCFTPGPPAPRGASKSATPETMRASRLYTAQQDATVRAKAEYNRTRTIDKLVQYSRSDEATGIGLLCEHMNARAYLDDLGVDGYAAIHVAAVHGKAEAMKELIKRGCSLDTLSKEGKTAEQYAKQFRNEEIVGLISKARANKDAMRQVAMTPQSVQLGTPAGDGKEHFQTVSVATTAETRTPGMEGNPQEKTPVSIANSITDPNNFNQMQTINIASPYGSPGSNSGKRTEQKSAAPIVRASSEYEGQNISPAFSLISEPKERPTSRKYISLTRVQRRGPTLNAMKGNGGVGISFGVTSGGTTYITGMAPGGPAEVSGKLFVGDQLLSVNGVQCGDRRVDDIVSLMVGEPGTMLTLEVASTHPPADDGASITPLNLAALASAPKSPQQSGIRV